MKMLIQKTTFEVGTIVTSDGIEAVIWAEIPYHFESGLTPYMTILVFQTGEMRVYCPELFGEESMSVAELKQRVDMAGEGPR